jgi:phage-related protein
LTRVRNFENVRESWKVAKTKVVLYQEADGTVPILEWLDRLPNKAKDKCTVALGRLAELGHELRRPEADLLRDGIYELRVRLQRVNYRMLYFFHKNVAAVVAHGLVKEDRVPPKEIDWALQRKRKFEAAPDLHTHKESTP